MLSIDAVKLCLWAVSTQFFLEALWRCRRDTFPFIVNLMAAGFSLGGVFSSGVQWLLAQ